MVAAAWLDAAAAASAGSGSLAASAFMVALGSTAEVAALSDAPSGASLSSASSDLEGDGSLAEVDGGPQQFGHAALAGDGTLVSSVLLLVADAVYELCDLSDSEAPGVVLPVSVVELCDLSDAANSGFPYGASVVEAIDLADGGITSTVPGEMFRASSGQVSGRRAAASAAVVGMERASGGSVRR